MAIYAFHIDLQESSLTNINSFLYCCCFGCEFFVSFFSSIHKSHCLQSVCFTTATMSIHDERLPRARILSLYCALCAPYSVMRQYRELTLAHDNDDLTMKMAITQKKVEKQKREQRRGGQKPSSV